MGRGTRARGGNRVVPLSLTIPQFAGGETEYQGLISKYPQGMKILISLAFVAAIAGIVYKVLTTEIPIDES